MHQNCKGLLLVVGDIQSEQIAVASFRGGGILEPAQGRATKAEIPA